MATLESIITLLSYETIFQLTIAGLVYIVILLTMVVVCIMQRKVVWKATVSCLAKAIDNDNFFSGRSGREEFWYFYLFSMVFISLAATIAYYLDWEAFDPPKFGFFVYRYEFFLLPVIYFIQFEVGARRLHDIGRSGWWQLIYLTIIGIFPLIYWFCKGGDADKNRFGQPSPL